MSGLYAAEFFRRRRRVHAVHAGLVQAFEFFCGGDVGEDHELLDQPVAVEPRAGRDAGYLALVVQGHLALRQVQVERAARGACLEQSAVG